MYRPLSALGTIFVATFALHTASAAPPAAVSVDFAPDANKALQRDYGAREADVLRSTIVDAIAKQERVSAPAQGLTIDVTVNRVVPTHPTMQQQLDDPSLSPARTRYRGGADLIATLHDASQRAVTVKYSNFADDLASGSPSLDPWADARVAIDLFAAQVAKAGAALK